GVGEHVEHVELRLRGVEIGIARIRRAEGFLRVPARLPGGLEPVEGEGLAFVGHGKSRKVLESRALASCGRRARNLVESLDLEKKNPAAARGPGGVWSP